MNKLALTAILALIVGGCAASQHGDKEGPEVKIELKDCPVAVQTTLKREAGAAALTSVDKESDEGKTIYEADITIDGKNYEIQVAEDGTLIAKKLDTEEDAKK